MALIDINANFGRNGLSKEGWGLFINNLDDRLEKLEKQGEEAKTICQETQSGFKEFLAEHKEMLKHGCQPHKDFKKEFYHSSTHTMASGGLLLSVGNLGWHLWNVIFGHKE